MWHLSLITVKQMTIQTMRCVYNFLKSQVPTPEMLIEEQKIVDDWTDVITSSRAFQSLRQAIRKVRLRTVESLTLVVPAGNWWCRCRQSAMSNLPTGTSGIFTDRRRKRKKNIDSWKPCLVNFVLKRFNQVTQLYTDTCFSSHSLPQMKQWLRRWRRTAATVFH